MELYVGGSIGAWPGREYFTKGTGAHLQQVHTVGLHAIHPLTYSLFDELPGDFGGPKHAPFGRADDFDRGLDVLYGSALLRGEGINERRKKEEGGGKPGRTLTQSVLGEDVVTRWGGWVPLTNMISALP